MTTPTPPPTGPTQGHHGAEDPTWTPPKTVPSYGALANMLAPALAGVATFTFLGWWITDGDNRGQDTTSWGWGILFLLPLAAVFILNAIIFVSLHTRETARRWTLTTINGIAALQIWLFLISGLDSINRNSIIPMCGTATVLAIFTGAIVFAWRDLFTSHP